ncbi:MAG: AI-2E family transporter [Crocinitomix sp.]|nr:AI-2E family transporter [Crocinitomix sp.]
MSLSRTTYLFILLISVVFILIIGKHLFIPLVLACLIWFLVKDLRLMIQKIPFIGPKMPRWLLNLIAVGLLYIALAFIVNLLINNITELQKTENMTKYEDNLIILNAKINDQFGFDIQQMWNDNVGVNSIDLNATMERLVNALSSFLGNIFMIVLYLLFLLLEESAFGAKILSISPTKERQHEISATLTQIDKSISKYITLKTLLSLTNGILSYFIFSLVGLDAPVFWAFLLFLLNFIPTIGALVGTLFPAAMAVLQFSDPIWALVILVGVGTIQVINGNIVEPRLLGNSLNVSSLVVILALVFWGTIWGITGMVLSVIITVILVILLGQFESTKNLAILLSAKGELDN